MARKKTKKQKKKYAWIMFWIFSAVLFINNTTQLLRTWVDLSYQQITLVTFIGIIGSLGYVLWLKD